jgi:hypothetical protein
MGAVGQCRLHVTNMNDGKITVSKSNRSVAINDVGQSRHIDAPPFRGFVLLRRRHGNGGFSLTLFGMKDSRPTDVILIILLSAYCMATSKHLAAPVFS